MSLKVANTIVITDDLRGRFANTTFTGGAYLVMPEDPSVERRNQGTISGYASGGIITPPPNRSETIDKFPFAVDTNATDVGDLTLRRTNPGGNSSKSHGYTAGGYTDNNPGDGRSNVIDKFPFATDADATDVGDMVAGTADIAGQSSDTHGHLSGGRLPPGGTTEDIERFPFAADNNAIDLADITQSKHSACGLESLTRGFTSGGVVPPASPSFVTRIDAFPFASITNAGITGTLATGSGRVSKGQQTESHGYMSGGQSQPDGTVIGDIQKFSFVSDSNASDVGDLSQSRRGNTASSSPTHGYAIGGTENPDFVTTIDKFPFASDGTATDVGDTTQAREMSAGHQR